MIRPSLGDGRKVKSTRKGEEITKLQKCEIDDCQPSRSVDTDLSDSLVLLHKKFRFLMQSNFEIEWMLSWLDESAKK